MGKMRLLLAGLLVALTLATPALAMEHSVGLGFGVVPEYEGADDYQAIPMLMLKGKYDSGRSFTLSGANLRVNVVPSRTYSFGPVLNYRRERDDVDNRQVDAMEDIDAAWEAGVYGSVGINNWQLGAEFLADISNEHDGMLTTLSLGYRWQPAGDLTVIPRVFTTYADDDYMETYFGVDAGNRGSSNLSNFKADGGFKDVGLGLVVDYTPWAQWGISGILGVSTLINDAKDSPIVDDAGDAQQMYFGLMGTYRWGTR